MVEVRMATPADAAGILSIYAPHVEKGFITFETDIPPIEEMASRVSKCLADRPWLVCLVSGTIAGYVYASAHRDRAAYQWSCESSVYTHPDYLGRGIASALYTALFGILKLQGFCNVYAGITLPNEESVRLHERFGFLHFATYENVGNKSGAWKDVGWWRLQLNDFNPEPAPPCPFPLMVPSLYEELLVKAGEHIRRKLYP